MFLSKVVLKLLNFIYPSRCYLCDTLIDREGLCYDCFDKLQPAYKHSCETCGVELKIEGRCFQCLANPKLFDSLSYCFVYNSEIFRLINGFKNHDKTYMLKFITNSFIKKIKEKQLQDKIDIVIPVPIHYGKLLKRKYNHMALLSKGIAKYFDKSCNTGILRKTKKTQDQMKLSGKKRLKNVKGAFNVNKNQIRLLKGKSILLVDDVLTTGSTINECVKTLKTIGSGEVHVICLARVDGFLKV